MDLYHLHRQGRQTGSQTDRAYSSKGQWDQYRPAAHEDEMRTSERDHEMRKITSEAARWKREHDKMKEVSNQLAYKAEQAAQAYKDLKERHQNLQANHDAMRDKARSGGDDVHQQLATKVEKWRARCMDAQSELEATREKLRARDEDLERLKAEIPAVKAHMKQAKSVQSELDDAKAELDSTKSRLKQAKSVQSELDSARSQLKQAKSVQSELDSTKAELDSAKSQLKQAKSVQSELDSARSQLASAKAKLAETATAKSVQSELASTKAELVSTRAKVAEFSGIESKLAEMRTSWTSTQKQLDELQGLKAELPVVKERLKTGDRLKAELATAQEQLRAATQAALARAKQHTTDMKTCADMLANAEQVLQACSDLYRSKDSPLGDALTVTANELGQFLKNLPRK